MKKTENGAYAKLRRDVAEGHTENLYLFYGEETYLKEHYKDRLVQLFGGQGFADFNVVVLDGDGPTIWRMQWKACLS